MTPPRIAVITPSFPPKSGGIATSHYNLFHLLKQEYTVHAFAYDDDDPEPHENVTRCKTPVFLGRRLESLFKRYLKKYDPDDDFPNCRRIANKAWGAWRLSKPLSSFKPDIILAPDNNVPVYFMKKPKNAKLIWYCRNNYRRFRDNPLLPEYSWADLDVAASMERKALKKADLVLSPSRYMADIFDSTIGRNGIPIEVIPNFMTDDAFAGIKPFPLREKMAWTADIPIVCLPSAGTPNKGKRYTFEIIRRLHAETGAHVAFFISGGMPNDLKFELDSLGKELKLYAPGHLSWKDNISLLMACDLLLSPTLVENFSNAFVEAHWLGKPIVTFDVGGNCEIVQDGKTGAVVPYLDMESLINRAVDLLCDRAKLNSYGHEAAAWAHESLNAGTILQRYRAVFSALCGSISVADTADNVPTDYRVKES